jgi:hypothetical protein
MSAIHSTIGSIVLVIAAGLALGGGGGCQIGQEGERCNPNQSHDECGAGLACQNPPNCPEYYCCPTPDPTKSTNPYCQSGCNGGDVSICASGGDASFCSEGGGDDGGGGGDDGGGGDGPSE